MEPLSVCIQCVDFVSRPPIPGCDDTTGWRGAVFGRVPVLRVFGRATNGESVCVHVHKVYPYFYIPYSGGIEDEEGSCSDRGR